MWEGCSPMSDLAFAHAGYVYQDLVTALCAIDVMLGDAVEIVVDTKVAGENDVFDDMTVTYTDGSRQRRQIKHQRTQHSLEVNSFVRDARNLRIDMLVRAAKADRAAFPREEDTTT